MKGHEKMSREEQVELCEIIDNNPNRRDCRVYRGQKIPHSVIQNDTNVGMTLNEFLSKATGNEALVSNISFDYTVSKAFADDGRLTQDSDIDNVMMVFENANAVLTESFSEYDESEGFIKTDDYILDGMMETYLDGFIVLKFKPKMDI